MSAISDLSPDQWREVRDASIVGVADETLAEKFGITREAIRQRRFREDWPTMERLRIKQRESLALLSEDLRKEVKDPLSRTVTAASVIAENLEEIGREHELRIAKYASEKARLALERDALPIPQDWKTLDVTDKMVRRSTNLDKPQIQVTTNVFNSDWTASERAVGEVEDG